jgi:hypothetical protein
MRLPHYLQFPYVGIETSIGKKSTLQFDVLASPWKSINGKTKTVYMFIPTDCDYHFKEKIQWLLCLDTCRNDIV